MYNRLDINYNSCIIHPTSTKKKGFTMRKSLLNLVNAKTTKGEKLGVLTGILYLAPSDVSGRDVCPKASDGCKNACLYTAGRGAFTSTQNARIAKTNLFFDDRETFMNIIVNDIEKLIRKAARENLIPAVRLNGTSDIAFEKIKVTRDGKSYRNVMLAFPDIQFYDYTKIAGRKSAIKLPNYHLTFSLSENNDRAAFKAITQGYNVAVVMNLKPTNDKPKKWKGYKVIDGDVSDARFKDPKGGVIVALTAKGKARKDDSGFVRDWNLIATA